LEENAYQTACTQACPAGAITFRRSQQSGAPGPPDRQAGSQQRLQGQKSAGPFGLLERLGTNTKVYYLSSREWVRRAGDNYLPMKNRAGRMPHH
jgi:Fe-S-cluster-containing dehydrogenase component